VQQILPAADGQSSKRPSRAKYPRTATVINADTNNFRGLVEQCKIILFFYLTNLMKSTTKSAYRFFVKLQFVNKLKLFIL
jgi:hypothetical protein